MANEKVSFDKALVALKEGKSITRESWIEKENRTVKFKKGVVASPKAPKEGEEPKAIPDFINGIKKENFDVSESTEVETTFPKFAMSTDLSQSDTDWSPSPADILGDDYIIK